MGGLPSWKIPRGHWNELLAPCKGTPDSLGFRIPGNGFWILCHGNLHIDFKNWWGSWFLEVYLDFKAQNPNSFNKIFLDSGFHKQNFPWFQVPLQEQSHIPISPVTGWYLKQQVFCILKYSQKKSFVSKICFLLTCFYLMKFSIQWKYEKSNVQKWNSPSWKSILFLKACYGPLDLLVYSKTSAYGTGGLGGAAAPLCRKKK